MKREAIRRRMAAEKQLAIEENRILCNIGPYNKHDSNSKKKEEPVYES